MTILYTNMNRIYLVVLLIASSFLVNQAQSNYQMGFLPSLNVNKKLPRDWSLHFKAESRQSLYQEDFAYKYLQTDLALMAATRIRLNTRVTVGYLLRTDGENIKNRAIQQLSFARRNPFFTLAHRVAMDQTFSSAEATEFRFRYRLSSEIPLEGQFLDTREFFLKVSNEYLNSFQESDYDLEIRGGAYMGYTLFPSSKIELGVDYRADSFINNATRNRLWLGLNFYYSMD